MRHWCLALVLLVGCATPAPAPKVPFEVLMTQEPSLELSHAIDALLQSARTSRVNAKIGAAMPASHAKAWTALLDAADQPTSVPEAARLRLLLETELSTDARTFGDIPADVAGRVPPLLRELSSRLTVAAPRPKPVDPRRFRWPVNPFVLTSPYGDRLHPIAAEPRFHAGVDLEAPLAHPVLAASDGTVLFAAWNGAHGKQVELMHDAHWTTRYSHLTKLLVKPGALVKKGQVIGLAGATGLATGPHVHFELRRDGDALDPEHFIPQPAEPLLTERP